MIVTLEQLVDEPKDIKSNQFRVTPKSIEAGQGTVIRIPSRGISL